MGSGTDSAEATKIVSDLRSLKSAAILYYGDHPKATEVPAIGELQKYMDKGDIVADNYTTVKGAADSWWVATNDVTNKIPRASGRSSGQTKGSRPVREPDRERRLCRRRIRLHEDALAIKRRPPHQPVSDRP